MGLLCMKKFIKEQNFLKPHTIRACNLVVDGSSCIGAIINTCLKDLPYGGDYDLIAAYTRNFFTDLIKSDVDCCVLFDGGHSDDIEERQTKRLNNKLEMAMSAHPGKEALAPVLIVQTVMDVLDDLKVPYAMCSRQEADDTAAALAKHLNCGILSNDTDFCLCESPLIIPEFSQGSNCTYSVFRRETLLKKYDVNAEVLPILSIVLENHYHYGMDFFDNFLRVNRITTHRFHRISGILAWLSKQTYRSAVVSMLSHVPREKNRHIRDRLKASKRIIEGAATGSFAFKILVEPSDVTVVADDPDWFDKGVATGCIAKQYIDLFYSKTFRFFPQPENVDAEDSYAPCLRILRYAFDLLTGFSGQRFEYVGRSGAHVARRSIGCELSTAAPERGRGAPFASGWSGLPDYFGHFLRETLPGLPGEELAALPADCRLWMVTLVWWRKHVAPDAAAEAACLMLCCAVGRAAGARAVALGFDGAERATARKVIAGARSAVNDIPYDKKLLHPFAQFQGVLQELNSLSWLCAADYEPVRYDEVYCGSYLYVTLATRRESSWRESSWREDLRSMPAVRDSYELFRTAYGRCVEACCVDAPTPDNPPKKTAKK